MKVAQFFPPKVVTILFLKTRHICVIGLANFVLNGRGENRLPSDSQTHDCHAHQVGHRVKGELLVEGEFCCPAIDVKLKPFETLRVLLVPHALVHLHFAS